MGFAEMTEIQEKTIPVMLAGRDVIAKAPTGTGKTCAFGIPVAEHIDPEKKYPQAVIMAPTRELAQQIAEELTELTYFMPEVQVACVYGGANMEKQAKRLAEGCQLVRCHLIVCHDTWKYQIKNGALCIHHAARQTKDRNISVVIGNQKHRSRQYRCTVRNDLCPRDFDGKRGLIIRIHTHASGTDHKICPCLDRRKTSIRNLLIIIIKSFMKNDFCIIFCQLFPDDRSRSIFDPSMITLNSGRDDRSFFLMEWL